MNLTTISFLIALGLSLSSCSDSMNKVESQEAKFEFPKLKVTSGNSQYIDTVHQMETANYVIKTPCARETDINLYTFNEIDFSFKIIPDSLPFSISNKAKIYIDNSQEISTKLREFHMPLPVFEGGFKEAQFVPKNDSVKTFPAYIVNLSDSALGIEIHDGRLIMIQEALDVDEIWKPIEFFSFSGCGNSFWLNVIKPNCYLSFSVNKYHGDFKTKLRVKLKTNGHTLYSNEYNGYINKSQFLETNLDLPFTSYLRER